MREFMRNPIQPETFSLKNAGYFFCMSTFADTHPEDGWDNMSPWRSKPFVPRSPTHRHPRNALAAPSFSICRRGRGRAFALGLYETWLSWISLWLPRAPNRARMSEYTLHILGVHCLARMFFFGICDSGWWFGQRKIIDKMVRLNILPFFPSFSPLPGRKHSKVSNQKLRDVL